MPSLSCSAPLPDLLPNEMEGKYEEKLLEEPWLLSLWEVELLENLSTPGRLEPQAFNLSYLEQSTTLTMLEASKSAAKQQAVEASGFFMLISEGNFMMIQSFFVFYRPQFQVKQNKAYSVTWPGKV